MQGRRGSFLGDFTEKQYDIIDAVAKVAEWGVDPGRVMPCVA
jgi:hypothetical protein